jgi:hypothetical protein
MISSSLSAIFLLLSADLMLTSEFASLEGATNFFDVAALWFCLPMDPNKSDLKGVESPET